MRIVTLIGETPFIERIRRRLGLWKAGAPVDTARDPP
jgi:hypothetical protein